MTKRADRETKHTLDMARQDGSDEVPVDSDRPTNSIKQQKTVAFYAASVNAWINTRMEKDKSLLSLSTAGVGFLVTLLTAFGTGTIAVSVFYGVAFLGFTITIFSALSVLDENADYLERIVVGMDATGKLHKEAAGNEHRDPKLDRLDCRIRWAFLTGVGFTILVGIATAIGL